MSEKLKACPNVKCGGKGVIQRERTEEDQALYYVECNTCGWETAMSYSRSEAISDWNKRPTCKWKFVEQENPVKNFYSSECGHSFHFWNKFEREIQGKIYCQFCSKEIEEE